MIRIKAERIMKGRTQEQLANDLNVAIATVQRWERVETNIPCSVICRLADFFGCSVDWLLGRSERRTIL